MEGYIKVHRKLIEWRWYKKSETVHLFIHLLLSANHADGYWEGISVRRGQHITGRKKLSELTGLSEQSIRTCLNRLKSTGEITIKSTNQFSIITICNYDKYNDSKALINRQANHQTDQQSTSDQPTTNQPPTTNKNEKNDKNVDKLSNILSQKISERVIPHFQEFIKQQKKPINDVRLKALVEHLKDIAPTDEIKIKVINQAIRGGHPDFRPLPISEEEEEYEPAPESYPVISNKVETKVLPVTPIPPAKEERIIVMDESSFWQAKYQEVNYPHPSKKQVVDFLIEKEYEKNWYLYGKVYEYLLNKYLRDKDESGSLDWKKYVRNYINKWLREAY
jgi:hypothetical protein